MKEPHIIGITQVGTMKKLHDDIFLFENVLNEEVVQKGLSLLEDNPNLQSVAVEEDSSFFKTINSLWFENIEDVIHEEYFKHIPLEKDHIDSLKKYARTDWRDMFFLKYYKENTRELSKYVHADFSTWTFSAAFVDANDYEGGRLCFPRQLVSYKINKGDMVVFPGGVTHMHYTEPIKEGTRIVLVGQSMTYKQDHRLGKKINN